MNKGTTATGFEFEISDDALDDYELLELLTELDNGDYGRVTMVIEKLLGKEQKERLKEHIRKNGKVSAERMMNEVADIFGQANEKLKN